MIRKSASITNKKRLGFSMIEMAIVITIIALLVGVISQSGRLTGNASLATARTLTKSSPVQDIDGLAAWFETTMPQSFADLEADNDKAVTTWYDLSPNKSNATSAGAPKYMTDVINGLPVMRFAGTSTDYLTFDGSAIANSNYTVFAVATRRSTQSSNYILGGTTSAAFLNFHFGWSLNSTPRFRIAHYSDGSSNVDFIDYVTTTYVSPIFAIHSTTFNSSTGRVYYENGTQNTSLTSSGSKTAISAWAGSAIGRFKTNYFIGDIAEIIIFDRTLTFTERKNIEQYLGKKWGISPIGTN